VEVAAVKGEYGVDGFAVREMEEGGVGELDAEVAVFGEDGGWKRCSMMSGRLRRNQAASTTTGQQVSSGWLS
jgi:hypothetical protein